MSIVVPATREPVGPTRRRKMTKARAGRIAARQDGICGCGCGDPLGDDYEIDHPVTIWMGGPDDDEALIALTKVCHDRKTAKVDAKARAKVKRIHRTLAGEKKPGPKLRGRSFQRDPLSWRNA